MNTRIYILNLKRSVHRKDFMHTQLAPLGIPYTFIEAVDGKHMDISDFPEYNSPLRIQKYGRDLQNTEVATSISHLKALKIAQKDMETYGNNWAVILEDDITILPSFVSAVKNLDTYPDTVHCVRLYERIKDTVRNPDCMDKNPTFHIHRSTYKNWGGALGYAIQKSPINTYIQKNNPILHIADKMLFGIPDSKIQVFQQRPRSVCITNTIQSDIGYATPHMYKGIRNNITRLTFRIREGIRRWIFIICHIRQYLSKY